MNSLDGQVAIVRHMHAIRLGIAADLRRIWLDLADKRHSAFVGASDRSALLGGCDCGAHVCAWMRHCSHAQQCDQRRAKPG